MEDNCGLEPSRELLADNVLFSAELSLAGLELHPAKTECYIVVARHNNE